MIDASAMKLGKAPAEHRVGTRLFADYVASLDWLDRIGDDDWLAKLPPQTPVFGNDEYGCCGFVGFANAQLTVAAATGTTATVTTDDVLAWYAAATGFRKDDPSTDNGVVLIDALHWAVGAGLIDSFLKVDHHNDRHVQAAEWLFGGTYNGAMLPRSAQDLSKPWVGKSGPLVGDDAPGSWGGHAMWRMKKFITWGQRQDADLLWRLQFLDESYVLLLPGWATRMRAAPNGFAQAELVADLARI